MTNQSTTGARSALSTLEHKVDSGDLTLRVTAKRFIQACRRDTVAPAVNLADRYYASRATKGQSAHSDRPLKPIGGLPLPSLGRQPGRR